MIRIKISSAIAVLVLAILAPCLAQAMDFNRIVVFGGSVSDSGNFFALTRIANRPPYDEIDLNTLIPTGPYSVGGNHYSNGATWIEQLARTLSLTGTVRPAFAGPSVEGTNYAVGSARAREDGINLKNMPAQVAAFLEDFDNIAPSDALYVIDFGGNDIRDALEAADPAIMGDALTSIASNMGLLYAYGARKFLVLTVGDIGKIPSIIMLNNPGIALAATGLTEIFNAGLDSIIGTIGALPGVEIAKFNVFKTVDDLILEVNTSLSHEAFGFTNATQGCITPKDPPFKCKTPDQYLFWDGIHPTKAGHAFLARAAAEVLGK